MPGEDLDPRALERDALATYLDDHHAGATGGVALAKRAADQNAEGALGDYLPTLHDSLVDDRDALRAILAWLDRSPSALKAAAGRVASETERLKHHGSPFEHTALDRLVQLEGLLVGSRGRAAIFDALTDVLGEDGERFEVRQRAARAHRQVEELDALRREVAREAFRSG